MTADGHQAPIEGCQSRLPSSPRAEKQCQPSWGLEAFMFCFRSHPAAVCIYEKACQVQSIPQTTLLQLDVTPRVSDFFLGPGLPAENPLRFGSAGQMFRCLGGGDSRCVVIHAPGENKMSRARSLGRRLAASPVRRFAASPGVLFGYSFQHQDLLELVHSKGSCRNNRLWPISETITGCFKGLRWPRVASKRNWSSDFETQPYLYQIWD